MILKGFKRKSNKKYLNKLLTNRVVYVNNRDVKSVGVIFNVCEFADAEVFKDLLENENLHFDTFKIIGYGAHKKLNFQAFDDCYNLNDFGWNGAIKNDELKAFLNTEFDVLISYYEKEVTELKLITAKSKSKFKIGILQTDDRLNDLIIKTNIKQVGLFVTEIKKYLTIFKTNK